MKLKRSQNVQQRLWWRIALAVIALCISLYVAGPGLLEAIERNTFDMRQRAEGVHAPSGKVTIVAVDEHSLAQQGRWPWPRYVQAQLIQKLHSLGAKVIALDSFYPEPENARLLADLDYWAAGDDAIKEKWTSVRPQVDGDSQLAQAIAAQGNTVLSLEFLHDDEAQHIDAKHNATALTLVQYNAINQINSTTGEIPRFRMPHFGGLLVNLPELNKAAAAVGHIAMGPDSDGIVRHAPLVLRYQDTFFPSADLYAAALFNGGRELQLNLAEYGITSIDVNSTRMNTDEQGRVLIHYHGPEGTMKTVSATDVLENKIDAALIRDRVVLFGVTAKGIGDMRATPWGASFPGVEMRANVIDNLITGEYITRPDWMAFADIGLLILLGLIMLLLLPRLNMVGALISVVAVAALYSVAAVAAFTQAHLLINMTYPVVLLVLMVIAHTVVRYFTVEREKLQIKNAFRHYVSPKVVDSVIDDVDSLKLGGDKREMTVLFSDVRDFTTTSEALPPEKLVGLLNGYLSVMTDKVFDFDGTLDKFIGDAVMAFWGAPVPRPDHALMCCKAAVTMMEALKPLQDEWAAAGAGKLDIGIGINTGHMTVGNMGSKNLFNFTVIGDAVNLASRLEGLNKLYGTHLLICESTWHQVKDHFPNAREIDRTQVKGKQQFVRVFELCLPQHYASLDWLNEFRQAYAAMQRGMQYEAMGAFSRLYDRTGDPVSHYHREQLTRQLAQAKS